MFHLKFSDQNYMFNSISISFCLSQPHKVVRIQNAELKVLSCEFDRFEMQTNWCGEPERP